MIASEIASRTPSAPTGARDVLRDVREGSVSDVVKQRRSATDGDLILADWWSKFEGQAVATWRAPIECPKRVCSVLG